MTKKYYSNTREEMLKFVPKSAKRILEVGCANGSFGAKFIERQNAEVWGIEPVSASAKQAESVLFKVINKLFSIDINVPKNYFDCIIFNDVIEHLIDPWEALKVSKIFLNDKPSSIVVASIPNFRFIGIFTRF